MKKSFLNHEKSLLTVMLQCETPETVIYRVRNSMPMGADAYGLQVESLKPEYHNEETYRRIFDEMKDKPCYVTNYRLAHNTGQTDEELGEGLIQLASCGATLCDVIGDMFSKHPEQITDDPKAIDKQMKLIDRLHNQGAEVLISSHLYKFAPAERVLEIAYEQKRRGADVIKIVTGADNMEQQLENLKISAMLQKEFDAPFLFLSVGESSIHRRLGMRLGCSLALCVYEHDLLSTPQQPLLSTMKKIRDEIDF